MCSQNSCKKRAQKIESLIEIVVYLEIQETCKNNTKGLPVAGWCNNINQIIGWQREIRNLFELNIYSWIKENANGIQRKLERFSRPQYLFYMTIQMLQMDLLIMKQHNQTLYF